MHTFALRILIAVRAQRLISFELHRNFLSKNEDMKTGHAVNDICERLFFRLNELLQVVSGDCAAVS